MKSRIYISSKRRKIIAILFAAIFLNSLFSFAIPSQNCNENCSINHNAHQCKMDNNDSMHDCCKNMGNNENKEHSDNNSCSIETTTCDLLLTLKSEGAIVVNQTFKLEVLRPLAYVILEDLEDITQKYYRQVDENQNLSWVNYAHYLTNQAFLI